ASDASPAAAAERTEFSSIVHRESVRLAEMLQTLLDLSRIEADKVTMAPTSIDLREAVLASYKRLRPQFKARRIVLKMRADTGTPAGRADARWIGRVFDALLSNAAKFSPEGAAVHVGLRSFADSVRVEVRDFGPGVPDALRAG